MRASIGVERHVFGGLRKMGPAFNHVNDLKFTSARADGEATALLAGVSQTPNRSSQTAVDSWPEIKDSTCVSSTGSVRDPSLVPDGD